jgi:hypothetical protein
MVVIADSDDKDVNVSTASSPSTSVVKNTCVFTPSKEATESLRAVFPHVDGDEVISALTACYGDEEAAASLLLDKQSDSHSTLPGQTDSLCIYYN